MLTKMSDDSSSEEDEIMLAKRKVKPKNAPLIAVEDNDSDSDSDDDLSSAVVRASAKKAS